MIPLNKRFMKSYFGIDKFVYRRRIILGGLADTGFISKFPE